MTDLRRALCGVMAAVALSAPACSKQPPAPSAVQDSETTANEAPSPKDGSEPVPLSEAIREWKARAGDHFTESGKALQQVSEASAAGDEAALRAGCTRLHDTNTLGLQRDLPTPDPILTDELQRMIDDINIATHACLRFALKRDDADAENYQKYLERAVEHLHRAKEILDADSVPG